MKGLPVEVIIVGISAIALGFILGISVVYATFKKRVDAKKKAEEILKEAEQEKVNIIKNAEIEAKELVLRSKKETEEEARERNREFQRWEKRLQSKESSLDKKQAFIDSKIEQLSHKQDELTRKEREIDEKLNEVNRLVEQEEKELERISGLSKEEAKEMLVEKIEEEAKKEAVSKIKEIEEEIKDKSKKLSQEILTTVMERISSTYVAERTVSTVILPNDDMKGRIIGREGRNIRSFEKETGTDLIIDDTPEAVVISSFNPLRREIAKIALERLIRDGRIHPARIEETVEKVREELIQESIEEVKQIIFDLNLGNMHPELIKHLALLKYRTSYTQNVLAHSVEVAYIAGMLAAELGLDVMRSKRGGLLHDIGKSIDQDVEGSHTKIGADLAKRYGEDEYIINAILSHHGEVPPNCKENVLISIADTLSAARPGARRERLENYIQRLEELEQIALSFEGVKNAYAIQAGRELRVIVEDSIVDDERSFILARDIARVIKDKSFYAGQIKVVVIREHRAVEYAA